MKTLNVFFRVLIIGFITFISANAHAQNSIDSTLVSRKVVVKMKNGEEHIGQFIKKEAGFVFIKTENGDLQLISDKVESITESTYNGKYRFPNPLDSRYFFGPTAIPLKQSKGYYQNVFLTTNFINLGITDNVSIGGGVELLSLMIGYPVWFFTPKVGFKVTEDLHVGGGLLMVGLSNVGTLNLAYGVGTYGSSENNVSFGLGYGFAFGEISSSPTILFGGTRRLGNNISLLSENYLFAGSSSGGLFGIEGIRILSPKSSFDIGLMVTPELISNHFGIPFVGYARAF